jgi:hypothetical protein
MKNISGESWSEWRWGSLTCFPVQESGSCDWLDQEPVELLFVSIKAIVLIKEPCWSWHEWCITNRYKLNEFPFHAPVCVQESFIHYSVVCHLRGEEGKEVNRNQGAGGGKKKKSFVSRNSTFKVRRLGFQNPLFSLFLSFCLLSLPSCHFLIMFVELTHRDGMYRGRKKKERAEREANDLMVERGRWDDKSNIILHSLHFT